MGNKAKLTADYFPHYAAQKKTVPILKAKFGSDGYACWYQLLEMLCSANGHFLNCSAPGDVDFLAAQMGIPVESIELILRELLFRGKIDRELWDADRIIWCQSLVDNLTNTLYSKREGKPSKPIPSRQLSFPANQSNYRDGNRIDSTELPGSEVKRSEVKGSKAFKAKALKGEQPATEETDQSDILEEGYNPPPDETNDPKDDTKPKKVRQPRSIPVTRFQEITKAWPNSEQIKLIDETVITNVDLDRFESVVKTWMLRGFKPTNVEGMIEWYRSGIPSRTNGGSKPIGKPTTVASTEEDLDDWKKLQAEQKERQDARAAKEKQGGS